MKSPFPGMDPYLESYWEDVRAALTGYFRDEIAPQLSDDLTARIEERVYVEDGTELRQRKPGVRIVETPMPWQPASGMPGTAVLDEPVLLEYLGDPIRQRSVLIYDLSGNRIVTAIELLSPWNKTPSKPLQAYLDKREKYINSDMNLVEIDLVRTGDLTDMMGLVTIPRPLRTTYRVTLTTPDAPGPYLYSIALSSKLPTIGIPLRPTDKPALLNLQQLVEKAYKMGRYNKIDYTKSCKPPLEGPDKTWADELLAGRLAR